MNVPLMEQIVLHIFANLGLVSLPGIDKVQSIVDKKFRLPDKKLSFYDGPTEIQRPVYGAQVKVADKIFKIMAGDCSLDYNSPEYCVVVQLTDMPAYGMYMVCDPNAQPEALMAVTMNNKDWMPCNPFLQATVLAAMEHLRDIAVGWNKCTDYQQFYDTMVTMVSFHSNYYGETVE